MYIHFGYLPRHSNVPGNETAEELAKQAATLEFIGPEPVLGISSNTAHIQFWPGLIQNTVISGSPQQVVDRQ